MSASIFSLILAQCEIHARRMLWAKRALQAVLPLNLDRLHELDDAQVAIVDHLSGGSQSCKMQWARNCYRWRLN